MATDTPRGGRNTPDPLYMLAFDHRQVLRDLYPGATDADLQSAKVAVLEALDSIPETVATKHSLGFLVDEEYGADAAKLAAERGLYVAMPVEASRTPILRLQYPEDYPARFERFNPEAVKALVFHNPADAPRRREEQLGQLRTIGHFAREQGRDYLLEILINPTPEQLEEGGGDKAGFRANVFPRLLVESIAEMQEYGIEPDIWKVEGLDTVEDTAAVGAQATAGGREAVRCIVLGSGESQAKVNGWLANAAAVPAFSGFAIGRTVWHEPVGHLLAGRISREVALETMALSFVSLISAFGRDTSKVSGGA
jgi:myo-inositol catabolism protein IolC